MKDVSKTIPLTMSIFECKRANLKASSNISATASPKPRAIRTATTSTLNLFSQKLKRPRQTSIEQLEVKENLAGRPKFYPPAVVEWFNSTYSYNKNTSKLLPAAFKTTFKLAKSYLNLYCRKLEKKVGLRRLRGRFKRLSTNRILTSRPELKHTNDRVIVTIYVYNRQAKYYFNKIKRIASIDNLHNFLAKSYKKRPSSNVKINTIARKTLKIRSKVNKHKNLALKMLNLKSRTEHMKYNKYDILNLKNYVFKSLRREIFSIYYKQFISLNKSKFEERYLLPLTNVVKKIYSKKVQFNVVSLRYLYLNSHIFSQTLVTKLSNRKNKLLRVLKNSLLMFKVPSMDRAVIYDEIYNKKRILENIRLDNLISNFSDSQCKQENNEKDILQLSLCKTDSNGLLEKLKDFTSSSPNNLRKSPYPLYMQDTILKLVKHKYVSGVRIEVAGRLTRRNRADRSIFKVKYKGNIMNMDSSYKGLPTVLLRGFAKSNLQYSNLKSKVRIGSFGLKGWVSSN